MARGPGGQHIHITENAFYNLSVSISFLLDPIGQYSHASSNLTCCENVL